MGTRRTFCKVGVEGFLDVPGRGEVDGAGNVVPFESDAAIHGCGPVRGDVVKGPEGCKEMLGIGSVNILDGKVVDHKGEGDRTGGMTEKSRCVLDGRVSEKGQVRDQ